MNFEIQSPELAQRVAAHIQAGRFLDADEFVAKALDALEQGAGSAGTPRRRIWDVIVDEMKSVPAEELSALPADGLDQVDHYVYGVPKSSR